MVFQPGHTHGFKPGQSGNPGGRSPIIRELREMARAHTSDALQTLVEVMKSPKTTAPARVAAACALLDRGYGRPESSVSATIQTQVAARLDYSVFTTDELALLDKLTPLLGRPGFLIEDDSNNGSPAAS